MIVLLWRLFCRFVIGTGLIKATCRRSGCWEPPSPICIDHECRHHCAAPMSGKCEERLTQDELDMVARYRQGQRQIGAVS